MFKIGDRVIYEDTEVTIVDQFDDGRRFAIQLDPEWPDKRWLGARRHNGDWIVEVGRGKWVDAVDLQPLAIQPVKKGTFIYVQYKDRMPAVVIDNLNLPSLETAIEWRDKYRRGRNPNVKIEVYLKLD